MKFLHFEQLWLFLLAKDLIPGNYLLFLHGDQDHSVPLLHSEWLRDAVTAAGGNIQLEVFAGEGHGFRNPVNVAREFAVTEDFLYSLMKNAR